MRPPRLLLLLLCFVAFPIFLTFLSLFGAHTRDADSVAAGYGIRSSRLRALFSFHTPASLFPPSAIISLTDDNSTFFLARPAAFGPPLPSDGLSSQLWVGSGFGEENLHKIGSAFGAEGELGCSDVPGWGEGDKTPNDEEPSRKKKRPDAVTDSKVHGDMLAGKEGSGKTKRSAEDEMDDTILNSSEVVTPSENDGTDDHLHHPLSESNPAEAAEPGQPAEHEATNDKSKTPTHADIQSLQESAEIAGKIVLLSRGGCGFLEKVKWVQRRGGVALIVGDDARGGPLIIMYARGDTSNVTISALFTSHTTAHLLSSLIPPETLDDQGADDGKDTKGKKPAQKSKPENDGPTFTAKGTSTPTARPGNLAENAKTVPSELGAKVATQSWFGRLLLFLGLKDGTNYPWLAAEDSRRPPSSGNIDWVLLEDWDEKTSPAESLKDPLQKSSSSNQHGRSSSRLKKPRPSSKSGDGFVIGVQDWRDPDVLLPSERQETSNSIQDGHSSGNDEPKPGQSGTRHATAYGDEEALKGGSITPGSGEYGHANTGRNGKSMPNAGNHASSEDSSERGHHDSPTDGWFGQSRWSKSSEHGRPETQNSPGNSVKFADEKVSTSSSPGKKDSAETEDLFQEHEGLWVTLTPTTMSTSPFFDTLLVLVVSPLVTLTVVYALLLLRSRIRRRRWRAPKSVVERLPVRVYHTMSSSSSTTSSQITSPTTSSPSSPLLRSTSRTIPSRNRPRSQTTSGVIASVESSSEPFSAAASPAKEKATNALPWKKRYTGRQVECVVCLEEYVDGQSRVMSLPCGHEFHADCM